ncbi:MAG: tetratricopeptide repeat protein [Thiobacillus sp.]
MSLLLKALKQAEATSETARQSARAEPDLTLEPQTPTRLEQDWVEPPGLLFGSSGLSPAPPAASRLPRLSLVSATALLATLIAIGYGFYLYIELQPPTAVAASDTTQPAPTPATALPPAMPAALPVAGPTPPPAMLETAPVEPAETVTARAQSAPPLAEPRAATPRATAPASRPALFQPDLGNTLVSRAYQAYQQGNLPLAQQLYTQAAAQRRDADALLGLAAIAATQNRESDAVPLYREVLERDPHNATAQAALLDLLGNTDSSATESRLKMQLDRQPSAHLYQTLGNLYASQQRWPEAQSAYFDALRLAPGNADYAFNLAVSLEQLRQPAAALSYYEKALAFGGAHRFDRAQAEARIQQLQPAR